MVLESQSTRQQMYTVSGQENTRDRPFTNVTQLEAQGRKPDATTDDISDQLNFVPKALLAVLGSTYCLIVLAILLVIPIIEIAIGGAYRNDCNINSNIPVYLIVTGVCGVATIVLTLVIVAAVICMVKNNTTASVIASGCTIGLIFLIIFLMSIFLFAWFIVGNVWIFSAKKDVVYDDPSSRNYCHRTLYEFAFTILIITYVMTAISCLSSCVRSCFAAGKNK